MTIYTSLIIEMDGVTLAELKALKAKFFPDHNISYESNFLGRPTLYLSNGSLNVQMRVTTGNMYNSLSIVGDLPESMTESSVRSFLEEKRAHSSAPRLPTPRPTEPFRHTIRTKEPLSKADLLFLNNKFFPNYNLDRFETVDGRTVYSFTDGKHSPLRFSVTQNPSSVEIYEEPLYHTAPRLAGGFPRMLGELNKKAQYQIDCPAKVDAESINTLLRTYFKGLVVITSSANGHAKGAPTAVYHLGTGVKSSIVVTIEVYATRGVINIEGKAAYLAEIESDGIRGVKAKIFGAEPVHEQPEPTETVRSRAPQAVAPAPGLSELTITLGRVAEELDVSAFARVFLSDYSLEDSAVGHISLEGTGQTTFNTTELDLTTKFQPVRVANPQVNIRTYESKAGEKVEVKYVYVPLSTLADEPRIITGDSPCGKDAVRVINECKEQSTQLVVCGSKEFLAQVKAREAMFLSKLDALKSSMKAEKDRGRDSSNRLVAEVLGITPVLRLPKNPGAKKPPQTDKNGFRVLR